MSFATDFRSTARKRQVRLGLSPHATPGRSPVTKSPRHGITRLIVGLTTFVVILAGCSSSPPGRYVDKQYGFSFKVPSGWTAPSGGTTGTTTDGVQSYVVHFVTPPGFRVVVRSPISRLDTVPNGKVLRNDPGHDCPVECIFSHINVSGRLGILTESLNKQDLPNTLYVATNSPKFGYEIQWVTAASFTKSQFHVFHLVVASFRTKH